MKTAPALRFLCASLLALGSITTQAAIIPVKPAVKSVLAANVEVEFVNPHKFSDIGDVLFDGPKVRQYHLDVMRNSIALMVPNYVGPSQRLKITFTDIDRLGGFPGSEDKRVMNPGYPAILKFSFQLTDANGKVSKAGERVLSDDRSVPIVYFYSTDNRVDPLYLERAMLDAWMKRELATLKPASREGA